MVGFFSLDVICQLCFLSFWKGERHPYGERLRVDSHGLMLPPEVEQKVLQGVQVVQVAHRRVHHQHHLLGWNTREERKSCAWSAERVRGRHLCHVFQKLGAGEAVLLGATVCVVVEEAEERRVQFKQPAAHKHSK